MHLLKAQAGVIADGSTAVDLGQSPGDIVILSAADTELASLAAARSQLGETFPRVRLANLMQLSHPASVDLYCDEIIGHAKLVIVRCLGGKAYWPYGVEQIHEACREGGIAVAFLPGDDQPDAELAALTSLPSEASQRLWQYLIHGGAGNAREFLSFAACLIGRHFDWLEPATLPRAGIYWPGTSNLSLSDLKNEWLEAAPVAAITFYRALVQAGNLAPVDALIDALRERGINVLPVYCASLKDPVCAGVVESLLASANAGIVLNATGFSVATPGQQFQSSPLETSGCPVLQVVFSGGNETDWRRTTQGLSARDLAMNVALPEVDGRIISRAVSFKSETRFDELTQCPLVGYTTVPDRIRFVAMLAANWLRLAATPIVQRRIAVVLANYPNRDGRIGNGVGLDTPQSAVRILAALAQAGYTVADSPADGQALIERLLSGPTNAAVAGREHPEMLSLASYQRFFESLSASVREQVIERWGQPQADSFYLAESSAFAIPSFRCANLIIGLQPARGYNIDPKSSYHDPDLVPPHGYLAFYAWLRQAVDVHAIVQLGKHGNLEWLPGKALALSQDCFPEAAFGALPHLYPFIVNDPGEGTQAKRRAQAVIVDHLTPPLTRAETYGPLAELEALVDEYFEAAGLDPRRLTLLREDILDLTRQVGLDKDCGISNDDDEDSALAKLDNYLCELKEMQIRGGLHIFSKSPEGDARRDLLIAITRLPRRDGRSGDASLIRALAADLNLGEFDPLDCVLGSTWAGPKPAVLEAPGAWRTYGDTVERLELLAQKLVSGLQTRGNDWPRTQQVLDYIHTELGPVMDRCGRCEMEALITGLDGRFLTPGPSGAPTRGRPDVLPTGRNFYSVDTRTVPTPAAWRLGWKSASLLLERHRQEHGCWPQNMALSAWGTSNMRTGGDDIAQALALLGVKPTWEVASRRLTGFEIIPHSILDRPRVDVTLRISGFFRDAFPAQIALFDSAVRAVSDLDEPEAINPLAARVAADSRDLAADQGVDIEQARHRAAYRVFGSKPGAYGAGLQALIDEHGWETDADLAAAYLAWGGYAYGAGSDGKAEHQLFRTRLSHVETVVHNQDNREHDILDSDDYYQFEGGMTAAVRHLSGVQPSVYHNDHSRPESPRIRTLKEEIARVVRARVVNPKWIKGVMQHGYKGAFEIAATVDYLFAFAATTQMVENHHFDAVHAAFLEDANVLEFLQDKNPNALRDIAERLIEAQDRGLWRPRSNSAHTELRKLAQINTRA